MTLPVNLTQNSCITDISCTVSRWTQFTHVFTWLVLTFEKVAKLVKVFEDACVWFGSWYPCKVPQNISYMTLWTSDMR